MSEDPKEYIRSRPPLLTHADAVIYYIQQLDIDMVNDLLEDELTYQDFPKHVFIEKLSVAFDEFIRAGNDWLVKHDGLCNAKNCNFGCTGLTFIGNNSAHYLDLIIDIKEGRVKDMYECHVFKNKEKNLAKMYKVEINRSSWGKKN